ncbi:MAG: MFS transporter [Roseateles sp.]|jgi:MFS transporter, DHA1 family, tetracycline resistance protein|nr:MFS transporter [Methylibium sp.]MBY0367683.1 MFS transporter [Burkholderiaceae bacterium]MCH7497006.1 MFS transporter [Candidatus Neomarinimicrobiota bacterium]
MTDTSSSKRTAGMGFIMVTVLIDMISIGLIVPVLPHIVGLFTQGNDEQTLGFLMLTLAFGVANFFGSPVLGALSDRFGRRPVLLIGFAGLALSFFVTASAPALWVLVVVRLFSGAMQSNIAIANAYVADITAPQDRAKRFGQLGAMFGLGFMLGPVIGGLLGDVDVRLPFYVAGCLAVVNWLYGFFVLPESLPVERRRPLELRKLNPVAALQGLNRVNDIGPLVLVLALSALAQFMLHTSWVLYTKFKFGWGPGQVGWSLLAVGVVSVISQGVLLRPLLKRFSAQRLAIAGMGSGALAYLGFGLASEGWMMYVVIGANLLGGVAAAAMQSIISNATDATHQGQTMGAISSLNSLMAVCAPIVALELLRWVSHRPAGDLLIGLPFFTCAALQALAMFITLRFFRRQAAAAQPA